MKTNNLAKFLILALIVSIFSCDTDDESEVLKDKATAGALVNVSATSNSSILGNPEAGVDLEDAEVTITNAYLKMTVSLTSGNLSGIEKIQIVKSYEGSPEAIAGESTTLPYTLEIDNIDALLADTGVTPSELRIGGTLQFRTKIFLTTGEVYYYNTSMGNYNMVVNCSSDLAGTYLVNYSSGLQPHYVTEISPGLYEMVSMLGWPTSGYVVRFTDTCGELFLLNEWNFSNTLTGVGYVDADGNLVWTSVSVEGVYDDYQYTMLKQ